MLLNGYTDLLSKRDVRAVLIGVLVAGLGAALTFTVVLAVQQEESFAAAGTVAAAMLIGDGVVIPVRGRLIDRYGHRVLTVLGCLHFVPLMALALAIGHVPVWELCVLAAASGVTNAPLFAGLRSLWTDVTDDPAQLQAAYSLQSVFYEVLFVAAPAIVAGIAVLASPRAALVAVAVCQAAGTLVFTSTSLSRAWRGEPRKTGWMGALEGPGMRTLALAGVGGGFLLAALEVGTVAFARAEGHAGASGLALAALAVASGTGGLLYGSRGWGGDLRTRFVLLSGLLALGALPLGLAASMPALVALLALCGVVIAPWVATSLAMLDRVAPSGTATEATTWVIAANAIGAAVGSAVIGHVAQAASPSWALEAGAAGGALTLAAVVWGYATLGEPSGTPVVASGPEAVAEQAG